LEVADPRPGAEGGGGDVLAALQEVAGPRQIGGGEPEGVWLKAPGHAI